MIYSVAEISNVSLCMRMRGEEGTKITAMKIIVTNQLNG